VHRDLKPGNVWLTADGVAKIGDFGLAVAEGRSRLTQHGMMVGTFGYMPPEQALGQEVTPQADLYSLGAMLYELVTGGPPFEADDPTAVISQHLSTPPVAPSWRSEECPPALEEAAGEAGAVAAGEQPLELLLAERASHTLLDTRQRHPREDVAALGVEVAHAPAPREEGRDRAVVVVLVDGGRGATAAPARPATDLGEESVDVRNVELLDRLREAELAADATEVGERVAVALDRAPGLALGLVRHVPGLSASRADGHHSLAAAENASARPYAGGNRDRLPVSSRPQCRVSAYNAESTPSSTKPTRPHPLADGTRWPKRLAPSSRSTKPTATRWAS
jgi:hypothetical protein